MKNNSSEIKIYGLEIDDDIYVTDIKQTIEGLKFTLNTAHDSETITLPLFGQHHVFNFLAASSIALSLGMSLEEIKDRAKKVLPTPHRLEIKKQGDITIIDNSYNTNPTASKSSLEILKDYPGKQKVLITPGLIELGQKF